MMLYVKKIDKTWTVATFKPVEAHVDFINKFEYLRNRIITERKTEDLKLIDNYTPENFDIRDQTCIRLLLKDDEPVAFSTLYYRREFGASIRCLNRLYWDPSIRVWLHPENDDKYRCNPRAPEFSPIMAEQQRKFVPDDFEFMFISRETPIKKRWSQNIAKVFTESTGMEWQVHDMLYPMCNPEVASCWQHVIYTRFNNTDARTVLDKGITFDEFRTRFAS